MLSMITNIYKKKTKEPTLLELFTATGKLKKFFDNYRCLTCVPRVTHMRHWHMCSNNLNIVSMCAHVEHL